MLSASKRALVKEWKKHPDTRPDRAERGKEPMNILETQLATVATGDTLTGTKDETNEAFVDERGPDEVLVDEHGAPVFRADDLETLGEHHIEGKSFRFVVRSLVEFALEHPIYPTANPIFGRFEFCDYSRSSIETRATFRAARAALDFLERDFEACELENVTFLETELAAFRAQGEAA